MLNYNTQLKKLILPEYGRNIQKMVDHCLSISDKDARTACAYSIVSTMEKMFPPEGNPEEYRIKLWDHLAIMSDFTLDIDWPYEGIRKESLNTKPDPIPVKKEPLTHSFYGRNLVSMIYVASDMAEGEERDALVLLIANQMKKILLLSNPDSGDDARVFRDIAHISKGAINLDPSTTQLFEFKALPAPKKKKKK